MRGTVAKRIRREVYSDRATSPKGRSYSILGRFFRKLKGSRINQETGKREEVERRYEVATFGADELRRRYQRAKRDHRRRP